MSVTLLDSRRLPPKEVAVLDRELVGRVILACVAESVEHA